MVTTPAKGATAAKGSRKSAKLGRPSSRAYLLEVAISIILEKGVEGLSFDNLAQKSGTSKSGIIYHFPNRDELNRAVRAFVRERYLAARKEATDSLPPGKSQALKGWAMASLQNRSNLDAVSAKIMTSGIWDADEGRAHHGERFRTISEGVGFDRAALVYLAVEGLWFLDLSGFTPFSKPERKQVVDLLMSIIDGKSVEGL